MSYILCSTGCHQETILIDWSYTQLYSHCTQTLTSLSLWFLNGFLLRLHGRFQPLKCLNEILPPPPLWSPTLSPTDTVAPFRSFKLIEHPSHPSSLPLLCLPRSANSSPSSLPCKQLFPPNPGRKVCPEIMWKMLGWGREEDTDIYRVILVSSALGCFLICISFWPHHHPVTCPHIPGKETKAQGGGMACPSFHTCQVAKPGNSVLIFPAPKSRWGGSKKGAKRKEKRQRRPEDFKKQPCKPKTQHFNGCYQGLVELNHRVSYAQLATK